MSGITTDQIQKLAGLLRGQVVLPDHPEYGKASHLASARNIQRPAALARCTGVADVQAVVRFAREWDLPFTVLAGGHELNGWGLQEGTLAIDLNPMDGVIADPQRMCGAVQAGARLGQMDRELAAHSLVVPAGTVSDTGVAGLTLGGGIGWLTRQYGATLDSVLSINAVTVDGDIVKASLDENSDLFWGMRGGGGNFAIATAFEFQVHPMNPIIQAGMVVHSATEAPAFLRFLRDFMLAAPEEVGNMAVLMRATGPSFPQEMQGKVIVATVLCHSGELTEGERVLAPLRSFRPTIADTVRPTPYTVLQQIFEGPLVSQHERRTYQQSGFLPEMTDAFIDEALALAEESPAARPGERDNVLTTMEGLGAAWLRHPEDSAAMPRGNAQFYWEGVESHRYEADDAEWTGFVQHTMVPRLRALSGPRAYLNHNFVTDPAFMEWAYGPEKYARLQDLKAKWDPENVLRFNKNIPPRAMAAAGRAKLQREPRHGTPAGD